MERQTDADMKNWFCHGENVKIGESAMSAEDAMALSLNNRNQNHTRSCKPCGRTEKATKEIETAVVNPENALM